MPIRVTLNRELSIIEVHGYGILLKSELEKANSEILRIHQEEGVNKILGDATRVDQAPSPTETFEIWSEFPRKFKHALVLRASDPTGKNASFIENIGVNRGQNIIAFETKEDALRWLLSERM